MLLALAGCLAISLLPLERERRGTLLLLASGIGLALFVAQALGIGLRGWTADWLNAAVRRAGRAPGRHRRRRARWC